MAPRLNKRQQRELEELEALGNAVPATFDRQPDEEESEEDIKPAKPSAFAALFDPGDDGEEDEEDSKPSSSKKKSKKKKKKTGTPSEATSPTKPSTPVQKHAPPPAVKNEKKAAKKARQKARQTGNDELDAALAELSVKYSNTPAQAAAASQSISDSIASLLAVNLSQLDGEAEMRRYFGSKVIQASMTETPGHASSSRRKPTSVRSNLAHPKPTWAPAGMREGLTVRPLTQDETNDKCARRSVELLRGERWWTLEYSKRYKGMTKIFIGTVQAGDPQGLFDMARSMPWHADTLLQMAQVFRHREEYATAVDFMERAMFAYERSFIGAFSFTTGHNRLDFDFVENRPFYLALNRQTADLQRRGCLRTAFEFAKLMYSLDPWGDPHGALFHLEYLAIKANMGPWLLDAYKVFSDWRTKDPTGKRLNPSVLPGWMYSRALALKNSSKSKEQDASADALVEAVTAFPSVVPLLADKLDVVLPQDLRAHNDFRLEVDGSYMTGPVSSMHLISHLYVQRALPVWKDHTDWFRDTITKRFAVLPKTLSSPTREAFFKLYDQEHLRFSLYRHVIVLEYPSLFKFIPKAIFARKSLDCDPLPPPGYQSAYDDAFFEGVSVDLDGPMTRRQRQQQERRLEMIIPDGAARAQFQAMYAQPAVAQMFPGGILQMIQALQDMPPELMEDLEAVMMAGMGGVDGAHGGMPGQMPGEAILEWGDGEESDGEDLDGGRHHVHPVPEEVQVDVEADEPLSEEEEEEEPDEETRNALAAVSALFLCIRFLTLEQPFRAISNWVVRGIWGSGQPD
ncbi:DUF654-domain-containing protein, partial [Cylindrobasidium torrendii FP15055 ss-10]